LKSALCGNVGAFPLRLPAPVFFESLFVFDMQQFFVLTRLLPAKNMLTISAPTVDLPD
jgi:hypothetical protein